jgi:Fe-Mn family superoxide dismutase
MNKRSFIKNSMVLAAASFVAPSLLAGNVNSNESGILQSSGAPFTLPKLPYAVSALEPHIDRQTMEIHHGKHHKGYVDNLNSAVKGTALEKQSIEQILSNISSQPEKVRNNAGGHYNHSLFWQILSPKGGGEPKGRLVQDINRNFKSFNAFQEEFNEKAKGVFGSGWAWLCMNNNGNLFITSTPNQDNPLMNLQSVERGTPIMGLDVWEHAYYLKYQNKRADYVSAFWNVINWNEVNKLYEQALAKK